MLFSAAPAFAITAADALGPILKGVPCANVGAETATNVPGQNGSGYTAAPLCTLCDFVRIFVNASNFLVSISGAVAILIFIYAGLMYLTVSFNPANLEKAKSSVKAAIIGLAFIFGGYTIVNFVLFTIVGGDRNMTRLYSDITGQTSWGVCKVPGK